MLFFVCIAKYFLYHIHERNGNMNWRYGVVDVRINIKGLPEMLKVVQEKIEKAMRNPSCPSNT